MALLMLPALLALFRPALLRGAEGSSKSASTPPVAAAAAAPAAPSVNPGERDLLAHGTEQYYWSADVAPTDSTDPRTSGPRTIVRFRGAGDVEWREIASFAAPARGLANRGNELLLVMYRGDWSIVSPDGGVRSGVALPGDADVYDLAGDGDDIWAIAAARKGQMLSPPSSLQPGQNTTTSATTTTTAASASTNSTTSSSSPSTAATPPAAFPPHDLGLFRLHQGKWIEQDLLPHGIGRDEIRAWSLAVIDGKLTLALASGLEVRVYTRGPDGWDGGGDVAVLAENADIKLLNLSGRVALWMTDPKGPGTLFIRDQRWSGPIKLVPSPKLNNYDRRSLVVALGRLRLLASDPKGRLAEQFYKSDGSLDGTATEAITIPRVRDERLAQGLQLIVLIVLIVWMLGSLRQRPALREALGRADRLNLAPLNRRLLGGVIDLVPLVAALVAAQVIEWASSEPVSAAHMTYQSPEFIWLTAGVGAYLLLATAFELAMGRSIGKLIAGTRVAALDGSRPGPAAILIRNLLRLVDLIMLLFPLSFVIFSPLRQRVGDMAAGTIVVMNDAASDQAPPEAQR